MFKSKARWLTASLVAILVLAGHITTAQNLFEYHNQAPALKADQQHYLSVIKSELATDEIYFVDVNLEVIEMQSFRVMDPYNNSGMFVSDKANILKTGSFSTYGVVTGDEIEYRSHFFLRKGFMRGEFRVDDRLYALRPIGSGLHVVYDLGDMRSEDCSAINEDRSDSSVEDAVPYQDRDLDYSEAGSRGGSPDCKVRLLCAYTNSVDNLEPDIQGYIENLVEYFNDANDNSLVPWHVELARSVEVAYNETETNEGSPTWRSTDLLRLQVTNDGWLDDVPVLRDLYDADMVIMFCDVVMGGSGTIGGQAFEIGATANEAYAVMRYNNTSTTFPHEFAHLHGCRHHDDSNTTPFAYGHGYDNVADGWETLLSKNSCCNRIQNFSNPDVDWLGDATGTSAYYDNARVMEETGDDHHDFQAIVTNKSVWQDEIITVDEVSDFQGATTLTNGTSEVDYRSGSTGTFRASSSVTLSPGFWARSGSDFTAGLETCANLRTANDHSDDEDLQQAIGSSAELNAYPNPFNSSLVVTLSLSKETEYSLYISDVYGKVVKQLSTDFNYSDGKHVIRVDVQDLATGLYMLVAENDTDRVVKQVVRTGN